jgi:hypothetical protein
MDGDHVQLDGLPVPLSAKQPANSLAKKLIELTGDQSKNDAFLEAYAKQPEPLDRPFWLRSHNQWITLGVALGWVGILCFALMYGCIGFRASRISHAFALLPILVLWLSFAAEDTLETSTGACLAGWFHSFVLMYDRQELANTTHKLSNEKSG